MAGQAGHQGRVRARVAVDGSGAAAVATGVGVLDHLLGLLAERAGFDLRLEVAPGGAADEIAEAGLGLGEALGDALGGGQGYGAGAAATDEALAIVALETSGRPRVV